MAPGTATAKSERLRKMGLIFVTPSTPSTPGVASGEGSGAEAIAEPGAGSAVATEEASLVQEPAPRLFKTVCARRFCDQHEMSLQTATGRSLP